MALITQVQSRKERRKQERKKRKQHHERSHHHATRNHESDDEEVPILKKIKTEKPTKKSRESKKTKKTKKNDDPYSGLDPSAAAAMRRDDEEIADLEMKLGLGAAKKEGKSKLHKEYAKLEGYGDDFGDFLDDLDDIVSRVSRQTEDDSPETKKEKKPKKEKESKASNPYEGMDPSVASAMRRDDEEIADLEKKLGLSKKKDKSKLHKEYAKLEGYGDDFGEFLDDLDDVIHRVRGDQSDYSEDFDDESADDQGFNYEDEDSSGEEIVPMKEPFEALDEDDSVLDDLEKSGLMNTIESDDEEEDEEGESEEIAAEEGNDEKSDDSGSKSHESDSGNQDDSDDDDSKSDDDDEDASSEEDIEPDHDIADTYRPTQGEDIYGNKVDGDDGNDSKKSKYVPPHLRNKQNANDEGQQEKLRIIQRGLNNSLNRLSEDTLISVAQQISSLYSSNPTSMVHDMLWKNANSACISSPMLMTALIPIYAACLVGVHIQTGDTVQVVEFLLEKVVTDLWNGLDALRSQKETDSDAVSENESKRLSNLMLVLCYMYNYNVVHCSFMYDIVRGLIDKFDEVDIECLLLLLSHCGRSLRSDDPLALKEIVLLVQKRKAEKTKASSSRVDYMVSAITDLKNNKRRQQDNAHSEKTMKLKKHIGRIKTAASRMNSAKTSSEASLRISLQDILNAETKGRWWKVGASWVGNQYRFSENDSKKDEGTQLKSASELDNEQDEALLRLASKLRMNTDRKRSIFCVIMGGTDCEDVFEKLCKGSYLQNRSERDTVRVLMECCGSEKSYNKYYGHLAQRLCEYQPQCKFSLQLAYWDTFKQLETMQPRKVANLSKLLFHLVVTHRALRLMPVLKALDVSADDMDENALIFLTLLMQSILGHFEDPSQVYDLFATHRTKISDFDEGEDDDAEEGIRSSLLLFFMETLKASPQNKKGSDFRKNFKAAVKALDTDGFGDMF